MLYSAKSAIVAQDEAENDDNLTAKLALLDEADPILTMTDRAQARDALISVQQRFDQIGRVPRDQVRPVEDRLRKVENHVRKLDDDFWQKNNPEKKGAFGRARRATPECHRQT